MTSIPTRQINLERFSIASPESFETIVFRIEREVGHPEMTAFAKKMAGAETINDLEIVVREAVGSAGLMEFIRFDLGAVLRTEQGAAAPKILRLVVGNPLIMKEMAKHVPDAASYAPVTILIDERADGVHLSYDRMASLLAPYGNPEALKVARDLDSKIEVLLTKAAS
jgi:hypothetical protein